MDNVDFDKYILEENMLRRAVVIVVFVLTACTSESSPTAQNLDTAVATAVAATQAAELASAPTLLTPIDGAVLQHPAAMLNWEWERPLLGDEVYDVRVWKEGEPHYGITWSVQSSFDLTDWLRQQQPGEYFWSIAVIVGRDGQVERNVSAEAPAHRFTLVSNTLPTPTPIPISQVIQVPTGFVARPYAEPAQASLPTVITFAPDGALYMLTQGGDIFRLNDNDGDHYAEDVQRIYLDDRDLLQQAVGMTFDENGLMYVSHSGTISTFVDSDGDGTLDTLTPIVEGLISLEYPFHSNNGIAFGADGKLYVAVGSSSDHGPLEYEMEAAILRMNPDGSDLEIFARGFRNPYDLAFSPDGRLFTADNNPDTLDETLRWLPAEELNYVREGLDYGFPFEFGMPRLESDTEPPVTEFFPSVATSGLVYYAAEQFPEKYRDGVFVALWGTAAPTPQERSLTNGRMVVFVTLEDAPEGRLTGDWEVFAWFDQRQDYRPIDVTVGPDGALYIAEFTTATVYRVEYGGDTPIVAVDPTATRTPAVVTPVPQPVLQLGEQIYRSGAQDAPACIACHLLTEGQGIGPSLIGFRDVALGRIVGDETVESYTRRQIVNPNEFISPGYNAGYMYQNYGERLTDDQLDAVVAYILSLGSESR